MNRLKKVMSIILTTVIVLGSCLCVASADEDITVTYLNADSTKIMVDLSTEVSESDLKGAVSLTLGGESVNIESVTEMPSTPKASGGMAASSDYSYVIIPEDGIAFDAVYNIKIDSSLLGAEYNKHFSVEKLWKEDFESAAYATALPWTTARSDSTIALEAISGDTMLKITKGSNRDTILPKSNSTTNFADTNTPANTFWTTAKNVTDYNVEMNVKFVNPLASGTTARSLRVSMQKQFQDADQSWVYGIAGGAYYQLKSDGTGLMKNMYAQIGNGTTTANGTKYEGAGAGVNLVSALNPVAVSQEPFGADDSTFTMAVKDQNIKVFAGDAFISYDFVPTISDNGIVGIVPYVATPFYVDDITVTKIKEYTKSEYTISPSGDDVEIGDEVIISFQKPVDEATLLEDNIEIYKDGVPFYGYSVNPGDKPEDAVIKFDMPFEYKTTYTIAPKGIVFLEDSNNYFFDKTSFTTEPFPYELTDFAVDGDPNMSFLNKGTYNVSATFNNHKIAEGMDVIVSICLFDENLKMIDMNIREMSLEMGEKDNITDTWTIDTHGKYIAKCFVWDSLEGMVSIITQTIE